jgi:hypothetical protein
MKKHLFLLIASVCLCYSCVSRQEPNYTTVTSAISATNNGEAWSATLTDTLLNDTLTLHALVVRNLLRIKFPITLSRYNLLPGNAQYFIFDDSGNITNTFKLDPSYTNTVTNIVNNTISSINKYTTGQFNARFIINSTGINTGILSYDTVTFINGKFTAAYK